jgi:hypothetical protein
VTFGWALMNIAFVVVIGLVTYAISTLFTGRSAGSKE